LLSSSLRMSIHAIYLTTGKANLPIAAPYQLYLHRGRCVRQLDVKEATRKNMTVPPSLHSFTRASCILLSGE
jgi:hypothetical protein